MNGAATIPGWSVPLHRSLAEPILLGGVPRGMAIALGTLAAAIGLGLQLWIAGVAIYLIGHAAALFLTRQDPQFGPVFARHLRAARRHLDV
jgi:type IV secretion system protein VirB3